MKKIFSLFFSLVLIASLVAISTLPVHAQESAQTNDRMDEVLPGTPMNRLQFNVGTVNDPETGTGQTDGNLTDSVIAPANALLTGLSDKNGVPVKDGLLPVTGHYLAKLYQFQPGTQEYVADLFENIGIPTPTRAYAQGTGYDAMKSFLPFWKVFRNLAYTLYIIMFIVVGIMIMLRTKVNAQTIITIQSALPNLLITLILITFSYAIVGFMIDLMYFLIYFVVFLLSSPGINIISTPTKAIDRLMTQDAWGVIFGGRNSIISAVAMAINGSLQGLGAGAVGAVGFVAGAISWLGLGYLIIAVWIAVAMLKLMLTLVKCYFMLMVQTITAPMQILMNAVPGSKAFSTWLKTTASYLLPFPVVASMFLLAAILIGDPSRATILQGNKDIFGDDGNPFGINQSNELYDSYGGSFTSGKSNTGNIWLPPFTLVDYKQEPASLMVILGFFIITMTPAAAKMAQDWLQVKESPYTSEIGAGLGGAMTAANYPIGIGKGIKQQAEQRQLMQSQANWIGAAVSKNQTTQKPGA